MATRTAASDATSALEMAAEGFRAVAALLQSEAARVRRRARVIAATPELQERELLKFSEWTAAITQALTTDDVKPGLRRSPLRWRRAVPHRLQSLDRGLR